MLRLWRSGRVAPSKIPHVETVRTIVLFPLSRSPSLEPASTKNDYENGRFRILPWLRHCRG